MGSEGKAKQFFFITARDRGGYFTTWQHPGRELNLRVGPVVISKRPMLTYGPQGFLEGKIISFRPKHVYQSPTRDG